MIKFKKGDKVIIAKDLSDEHSETIGETGEIVNITKVAKEKYPYEIDCGDEEFTNCNAKELVLLDEKKAKWIVKYDLEDKDPIRFFKIQQEAKDFIRALLSRSDLVRASVLLIEIGNKWEIESNLDYTLKKL